MHYNCYIVCGQAPNVSLLAGYTLLSYPDLKPLKIKLAKRCTYGLLSNFYSSE